MLELVRAVKIDCETAAVRGQPGHCSSLSSHTIASSAMDKQGSKQSTQILRAWTWAWRPQCSHGASAFG